MAHIGTVITWLFAVLGAVTAVVQIWKWTRGRRADRGLEIFLESQADREDAETAHEELKHLQEALDNLKVTARSLAHQMHLEQRKIDLERTLGRSWEEYKELLFELGQPESHSALPSELVDILVSDIAPRYRTEQRERRRTNRLLLILVAALLLPLPFTPSSMLYLVAAFFSYIIMLPAGIGELAYASGLTLTFAGVLCGIVMAMLTVRRWHISLPVRGARVAAIILSIAIILTNAWSIWAVYTTLYWGSWAWGYWNGAIEINIAVCIISILVGSLVVLGKILPASIPRIPLLRSGTGRMEA
jgi:hypothetical protein